MQMYFYLILIPTLKELFWVHPPALCSGQSEALQQGDGGNSPPRQIDPAQQLIFSGILPANTRNPFCHFLLCFKFKKENTHKTKFFSSLRRGNNTTQTANLH